MEIKNFFLVLLLGLIACTDQKERLSESPWHINSYYTADVSNLGNNLKKEESPIQTLDFSQDSITMDDQTFAYQLKDEYLMVTGYKSLVFEISELTDKNLRLLWREEDQKVHHFFSFTR